LSDLQAVTTANAPPLVSGASPAPAAPLAVAKVQGELLLVMPQDLIIPPDALEIFLDMFEGPLDLLLYLIQRQHFDILNIPIATITDQYLQYIGLSHTMKLDLAAEYLLMAALLLEIKSRMLLPRTEEETAKEQEEQDLHARLTQQLQAYAQIKQAAIALDELPRIGRDTFLVEAHVPSAAKPKIPPNIVLEQLVGAMQDILQRLELYTAHQITREPLSVRERMSAILLLLAQQPHLLFQALHTNIEGRAGVVVSLLAVLELGKERMIMVHQEHLFGPIHLQSNALDVPQAMVETMD